MKTIYGLKPFLLLFSGISFALGIPTDSTNQTTDGDSIVTLEKVTVTATRSQRRISETPASVSVITRKEIAASPAKTIEDLLSAQTGVQPRRSVSIGEGIPSDIMIRGIPGALAATRTLILVDGIPTNASGTPFLIVNEVPLEAIERIEIVRGPNSSLYGANALGGVINILTREGQQKPQGTIIAETSYPFNLADRISTKNNSFTDALEKSIAPAYWNTSGSVSGGTEKTGVLVSTGYRTIGNYLLRDYAISRNGDDTIHLKNRNYDYEEFRVLGKAKFYTTDKSNLTLHMRYFKSELGFGKTKKIVPDSMDIITSGQKFLFGPQFKFSFSKDFLVKAGGFYRNVIGEFQNEGMDSGNTPVQSIWQSKTNDWQFESQGVLTLNRGNTITAGFEFLSNSADFGATRNLFTHAVLPSSFSAKKGIYNGAAYLQNELEFFKRLRIVPVIRLDYHSAFRSALSPKLGINYKIFEQLKLRSSIGRSFRAPSLAELYLPDLVVNPNFVLKANSRLVPEFLTGADAGIETTPHATVTFKADIYSNTMSSLISQAVILDGSGTYVTHRNISKAWSRGIESELTWRPVPSIAVSANNTLQKSLDKTYLVSLDYVPDYTVGGSISFSRPIRTGIATMTSGYKRIGPRGYLEFTKAQLENTIHGSRLAIPLITLDPYTTVDLSGSYKISRYSFTVTGQNIFNAAGEEAGGTITPGRFASMKFGYDFY